MTDKKTEALKLALEALEEIHPGNMTPIAEEAWNKAITAIREALAEQPAQQEPVANDQFMRQVLSVAIAGLYEHYKEDVLRVFTLADLQAVVDLSESLRPQQVEDIYKRAWDMLAAAPQPAQQQEPVGWMHWLHGPVRLFLNKDEAQMELERLNREYPVDVGSRKMRPLVFGDTSPPASKPLTDEQINLFINGRGEEGDDDYVEPTGDGFGLTDADLVHLVRRVEAAHGIMSVPDGKGDA